jgi:hypothetical protein
MAFTFDPDLGDELSRTRALLLDTVESGALFSDEAIQNYLTLYGVDNGTAQLALILLNTWGNEPTSVTVEGIGVTWGARFAAWNKVISDVRQYGIIGGEPVAPVAHRYRIRRDHDRYHQEPRRFLRFRGK